MSALLFLNDEHFKITDDKVLGINIKGIILVLFYSNVCPDCKCLPFIPIFKSMPRTIGCQFGIINISTNRAIIEMSKNTQMPIRFVPYVVLYVNGKPVMSYDGPPSEEDIRAFILHVLESNKTKQQFVVPEPDTKVSSNATPTSVIPGYTIGKPKNSERHHRDWSNAYKQS